MADIAVATHTEAYEPPFFGAYSKKVGMWLFLVSDTLTFGALLFAYTYGRISIPGWPTPFDSHSIMVASTMTAFLLTSSLTMVLAVLAAQRHDRPWTLYWLLATMFCGIMFILLHGWEWLGLIEKGMTPTSHPSGVPLFGGTFFTLTGMHLLLVGAIISAVVLFLKPKDYDAADVEVSGLYWHFVDLVWMFIFPLVYLMSTRI